MYTAITSNSRWLKNKESEANVIVNYALQQPFLKGLALQYIFINYDVKHGNDFSENRFFVITAKILMNKEYV